MNPFSHTGLSISDSLKSVRKSVLIYETIIDKRVRHLYLTEKAVPAVKRIKEIHRDFYTTICSGISAQDIHLTEQALAHMVENINQKVWHRMEE